MNAHRRMGHTNRQLLLIVERLYTSNNPRGVGQVVFSRIFNMVQWVARIRARKGQGVFSLCVTTYIIM